MKNSTEQYLAGFEAWARANGHPIRFNADGSYAGMNSYRFEGYAGAAVKRIAALRAAPASQHDAGLSSSILSIMYQVSQRGDSVERAHEAIMGVISSAELATRFRAEGGSTNDEQSPYTAYVKKCEAGAILPCSEESFREDAKDAARYRWLTQTNGLRLSPPGTTCIRDIEGTNAYIDAAIEAHKAGSGHE